MKAERVRNVGLRIQTGCCKPSRIDRHRELTNTDKIREIAAKAAAVLLEKTSRVAQADQLLANAETRKNCRIMRSTAKDVGEERLAKLGILPLKRLPIPPITPLYLNALQMDIVKFAYTDCSRSDDDPTRLRKAQETLHILPHSDIDIWTDASVGSPARQLAEDQPWPVSVQWEEKCFTASAAPYSSHQKDFLDCTQNYRTQHGYQPTHILFYEDGETQRRPVPNARQLDICSVRGRRTTTMPQATV